MDAKTKKLISHALKNKCHKYGRIINDHEDAYTAYGNMLTSTRIIAENEGYIEYGMLTAEEANDVLENMIIHNNSPHDCTGKPFTFSLHTHTNPCSLISFVHEVHLDI